jgi:hypothetical protein
LDQSGSGLESERHERQSLTHAVLAGMCKEHVLSRPGSVMQAR